MGLDIDYFYRLSPREFDNILAGYFRKKDNELKTSLILNRRLMFTFVSPYIKDKNATEEKMFPFSWEKNTTEVDLAAEIAAAEDSKEFWRKVDENRRAE